VHGVVFDVFVLASRPGEAVMARFEGNIAKVSAGCTGDMPCATCGVFHNRSAICMVRFMRPAQG
jgi:hypothetical protein